jgi:membrane associated rhomboid family serine protease
MAFLQPEPPRQPIFNVPAVVLWLVAILAGLHLARVLAPAPLGDRWIETYAFIPAIFSPALLAAHHIAPPGLADRALTFVTYMGLHNDITHLAVNSLWLLAFGPVVARRFGAGLFLAFFLICGVAGAAAYLALNWGSPDPMIGASGAISGLMAAGLRLLPTLRPGTRTEPLLPALSRQVVMFSLVWGVINIVAGVTGLGLGGQGGAIAWQAHLGGYLAGLLLAGPFDALRPQPVGLDLDRP